MPIFTNPRRTPCFGTAPTLEDFEAIAAEALATIPEEFRRHVGNVRIQVDDFPSDEVEKEMELDTPFDLLGDFLPHQHRRHLQQAEPLAAPA